MKTSETSLLDAWEEVTWSEGVLIMVRLVECKDSLACIRMRALHCESLHCTALHKPANFCQSVT